MSNHTPGWDVQMKVLSVIEQQTLSGNLYPTLQEIGNILGISRERVRQICVPLRENGDLAAGNPIRLPSTPQRVRPENTPRQQTVEERFLKNVVVMPNGCHEWTGAKMSGGHGNFGRVNRKCMSAHQVAWLLYRGPLPVKKPGQKKCQVWIVTSCRNPGCVNPHHLYLSEPSRMIEIRHTERAYL